mmetsp:Transcript_22260/g.53242  ORF Transcript_22260/g.53242 Transcript_22260/m.53242 type:complete len:109 (+) Transcript_22260:2-328(+)
MAREKARGRKLELELKQLELLGSGDGRERGGSLAISEAKARGSAKADSQAATAGVPTSIVQQRLAIQKAKETRKIKASGKHAGGWGYATIDQVSKLSPAVPKLRPSGA